MLPSLRTVDLQGEFFDLKTPPELYLQELSTGTYSTISEKLIGYSRAEEEEMTSLRYMTFIVFLSLWEHFESTFYKPLFHRIANEWYANQVEEGKTPKVLLYRNNEYTQTLRKVTADEFVAITDYWADTLPREEVERLYKITDEVLQATSERTKTALKNE